MTDIDVRRSAARLLTANGRRFEIRETRTGHYTLWIATETGRWCATPITATACNIETAERLILKVAVEGCATRRADVPATRMPAHSHLHA